MNTELVNKLQEHFQTIYGHKGKRVYFAPGRVNLIGEHTDYNGGHVFPCALSVGTYGMIAQRDDDLLRMYSVNLPDSGIVEVSLKALCPGRIRKWTQYPEGVFWSLQEKGYVFPHGADLMIAGDVPSGSGLSSSASLEVLTGLMIRELYGFSELTNTDLALIGQNAENKYCEMQCGIMDQFASAMGKKDHAIYLNTETLEYELVPLMLGDYELLITNSKVKHSLVSSAYNDRRRECAKALANLKKESALQAVNSLCELTPEQFVRYRGRITDSTGRKRAKHAIYENARTIRAVNALQENDIAGFGQLMNESHDSLRDDYEVSCVEIDFLVDAMREMPGVAGSRITGGGFGGCTVSIVKKEQTPSLMDEVCKKYQDRFGIVPEFYRVAPEEGVHVIDV